MSGVGRKPRSVEDRLWSRVDFTGLCWEWQGQKLATGYGLIANSEGIGTRTQPAHRVAWTLLVGPIPAGLELDHLCRNRGCVNPDHLEPVTHAENMRRSICGAQMKARARAITSCPKGHRYSIENTYMTPSGGRKCRECGRVAYRAWAPLNRKKAA